MTPNPFFNCLSYNGILIGSVTGSLVAAYDLGSGSGTSVIYNLVNPTTGYSFSGNNLFAPALPLASVGVNPLSYRFTGVNSYRLAGDISGDFAYVADIEYSGCQRNTTGISYVLFSTQDNSTGSGTFFLSVNDMNRLSFQSSGYSKTLNYELKDKNLIYVGLGSQKYLDFGVFDVLNNTLVSESITLDILQKDVNRVYIGGFLNTTPDTNYTGYFGRINNVLYFNEQLPIEKLKVCADCVFATGVASGSPTVTSAYLFSATGYLRSGVIESVLTGSTFYTGSIQKSDGSLVSVAFLSGQSQSQQTSEISTLLTGVSLVSITGAAPLIFIKDTGKLNGFTTYSIEFDQMLTSGDTLEIHTYPSFNANVNLPITNLEYPTANYVQLVGNGLVETFGIDYQVDRDLIISGFYPDDILLYDNLTGASLVTSFSGYWTGDRVAISGGTFYPTAAQFLEKSGLIFVSGINGTGFDANYDVYMDGQKLNSGVNYFYSGVSGSNYAVFDPAYVPRLVAYPIYASNGQITGVSDVEDAELAFLPSYGQYIRYFINVTGDTSVISPITGFTERVWLNGIRQRKVVDYLRNFTCTVNSGVNEASDLPFVFYDNGTGLWGQE